jgi:hypothetical protein
MGANMMPTAKKRGRTVFGVRMGLDGQLGEGKRDRRTARPLTAVAGRRYLGGQYTISGSVDALGGLRLFCFLSFAATSELARESSPSVSVGRERPTACIARFMVGTTIRRYGDVERAAEGERLGRWMRMTDRRCRAERARRIRSQKSGFRAGPISIACG